MRCAFGVRLCSLFTGFLVCFRVARVMACFLVAKDNGDIGFCTAVVVVSGISAEILVCTWGFLAFESMECINGGIAAEFTCGSLLSVVCCWTILAFFYLFL